MATKSLIEVSELAASKLIDALNEQEGDGGMLRVLILLETPSNSRAATIVNGLARPLGLEPTTSHAHSGSN